DPATARMRPVAAAVMRDVVVIAAGIHQSVGEDRHALEGVLLVDGVGQIDDRGCKPARIERDGAEGVAEDTAESADRSLMSLIDCLLSGVIPFGGSPRFGCNC